MKIYFTLPTATFKEAAKVIDFSEDFICFFFRKTQLDIECWYADIFANIDSL